MDGYWIGYSSKGFVIVQVIVMREDLYHNPKSSSSRTTMRYKFSRYIFTADHFLMHFKDCGADTYVPVINNRGWWVVKYLPTAVIAFEIFCKTILFRWCKCKALHRWVCQRNAKTFCKNIKNVNEICLL